MPYEMYYYNIRKRASEIIIQVQEIGTCHCQFIRYTYSCCMYRFRQCVYLYLMQAISYKRIKHHVIYNIIFYQIILLQLRKRQEFKTRNFSLTEKRLRREQELFRYCVSDFRGFIYAPRVVFLFLIFIKTNYVYNV